MNAIYYRTGQAAKLLGVSAYHIRRLCETDLVEHHVTSGGHYRIFYPEIQRLSRDGVPPIPQGAERRDAGMSELKRKREKASGAKRPDVPPVPQKAKVSYHFSILVSDPAMFGDGQCPYCHTKLRPNRWHECSNGVEVKGAN